MTKNDKASFVTIIIVLLALVAMTFACRSCNDAEAIEDCNFVYDANNTMSIDDFNDCLVSWEIEYPLEIQIHGLKSEGATLKYLSENTLSCDVTEKEWGVWLYESITNERPTGEVIIKFKEHEPIVTEADINEAKSDTYTDFVEEEYDEETDTYSSIPPDVVDSEVEAIGGITELEKLLDSIPTWPKYVELEENLIICPAESNEPFTLTLPVIIEKGTKIYYEDD